MKLTAVESGAPIGFDWKKFKDTAEYKFFRANFGKRVKGSPFWRDWWQEEGLFIAGIKESLTGHAGIIVLGPEKCKNTPIYLGERRSMFNKYSLALENGPAKDYSYGAVGRSDLDKLEILSSDPQPWPFGFDSGSGLMVPAKNVKDYPSKCPRCGGPAYISWMNVVDCMQECK